jgi:hypothetical protein
MQAGWTVSTSDKKNKQTNDLMTIKKTLQWAAIILGAGTLPFVCYAIWSVSYLTGMFDDHHSKQELIDNYNAKAKEIFALKGYIDSVVIAPVSVAIEFDGNNKLLYFHVVDSGNYDSNWDLKLNSTKVDTLLIKLNWTKETLSTLKAKLDDANCISISSGEPCNIGWQRSGMGMYFYNIFNKPILDSLKNTYNDSCQYILFSEKIVLQYKGGAIGPDCFPDRN